MHENTVSSAEKGVRVIKTLGGFSIFDVLC